MVYIQQSKSHWDGFVVSVSAPREVGHGFTPWPGHTEDQWS